MNVSYPVNAFAGRNVHAGVRPFPKVVKELSWTSVYVHGAYFEDFFVLEVVPELSTNFLNVPLNGSVHLA